MVYSTKPIICEYDFFYLKIIAIEETVSAHKITVHIKEPHDIIDVCSGANKQNSMKQSIDQTYRIGMKDSRSELTRASEKKKTNNNCKASERSMK